jgi:hypothetical protein
MNFFRRIQSRNSKGEKQTNNAQENNTRETQGNKKKKPIAILFIKPIHGGNSAQILPKSKGRLG